MFRCALKIIVTDSSVIMNVIDDESSVGAAQAIVNRSVGVRVVVGGFGECSLGEN